MALITNKPRSASARAVRNTVCFVINAQDFRTRLGEVSPFMQVIVRVLAENVRQSNSQIDAATRRIRSQERVLDAARKGAEAEDPARQPKARSSKGVVRGE